MKTELLKKFTAYAAALAMTAQLVFVPPAGAATGTFLKTDFDDVQSTGAYTWGTEIIKTNSNDELNSSKIDFATQKYAAVIGGGSSTVEKYDIVTMADTIGDIEQDLDIEFKLAKRCNNSPNSVTVSFDDTDGNTLFGIKYLTEGSWEQRVQLLVNDNTVELPNYTDNEWRTYNLYVGYISENTGYVAIGDTILPYDASAVKSISLKKTGNTAGRGVVFDDLMIDTIAAPQSYLVTYDVDGTKSYELVLNGGHPSKAPDYDISGKEFAGWNDGNKTSKNLLDFTITANSTLTATYTDLAGYVEPVDENTVIIEGPVSMAIGANADTNAENEYKVVLTGVKGTEITKATKADNAVLSVAWEIEGFKTANDSADNIYCDGYGDFVSKVTDDVTAIFNVRKHATQNFYGKLTATVTYGAEGETPQIITAEKYVVALCNPEQAAGVILPAGGHPSDFDDYPDVFEGYSIHQDTYGGEFDDILSCWVMAGGDDKKSAVIAKEGENKFIRVTTSASSSHMFATNIDAPTQQIIFEQNIRFNNNNGVISMSSRYPYKADKGSGIANPIVLQFSDNKLALNAAGTDDNVIKDESGNAAAIQAGAKWYRVVLSIDPVLKTSYARVYDGETLVGSIDNVPYLEDFTSFGTYYGIGFANWCAGTIDFDNYRAFIPTADTGKLKLTAEQNTLSIPKNESTDVTATVVTAEGYPITGKPEWEILEDGMRDAVVVTPDAANPYKAHISLADSISDSDAGPVTVQITMGGYTMQTELQITSAADTVRFTSSPTSLAIRI